MELKQCETCDDMQPTLVRITAARDDGTMLDTMNVCWECFQGPLCSILTVPKLEWHPSEAITSDS